MLRDYLPLPSAMLQAGVGYAQPTQAVPERATLEDAASVVMTDLTRVTAVICLPGDTVDEAHRRMIQRGVRLLLVVDQDRRVVGVVTATESSARNRCKSSLSARYAAKSCSCATS
jgi:CBS-domain-containing membrane protein